MSKLIGLFAALAALVVCVAFVVADEKGDKKVPAVLNFTMKTIDGNPVDLSKYQGKVVLLVNVASYCGYTKQYTALEALHEKYGKDGLAIVGIPANEFGKQEPGSNADIKDFCTKTYNVKFDMLSKVVVKGDGQSELYKYLTSKDTNPKFGGEIQWNFTKFLIGRNGEIVARYEPAEKPDSDKVVKAIEEELAKK
jgi:glutathione peroxidase